jgi:hypothetical protein
VGVRKIKEKLERVSPFFGCFPSFRLTLARFLGDKILSNQIPCES